MMKKILLVIVIIVIVAIAAVWMMLDTIAKNSIEKIGSSALNTQVAVGSVHLSLLDGSGTIDNLTIANPTGYPAGFLLQVQQLSFKVKLASLLSPTILIPNITIDNPTVSLITGSHGTNLNALMDGMSSDAQSANRLNVAPTSKSSSGKKVEIDQLLMRNVHIKAQAMVAAASMTIPKIEVANIGKDHGVDAAQAIGIGLKALFDGVLHMVGLGGIVTDVGSVVKNTAQGIGAMFKGLLSHS